MTDDLVTFLRTRLDEEERFARAAAERDGDHWDTTSDGDLCTVGTGGSGYFGIGVYGGSLYETGEFIARHDPARVLREVEAKRALLEEHREVNGECMTCVYVGDDEDSGGNMRRYREHADFPCTTVQLLALPYSDHSDYRDEWKP